MPENQYFEISNRLKAYIKALGLTQQDVAARLGVTQVAVNKMLNGKPFGKNQALKWNIVFGINPNWLRTGEGEMFTGKPETTKEKPKSENETISYLIDANKGLQRTIDNQAEIIKRLQRIIDNYKAIESLNNKN